MRYYQRYILSILFTLALPHIIYECIRYKSKEDKWREWLLLNLSIAYEDIYGGGLR
jgi:hypothetical protein